MNSLKIVSEKTIYFTNRLEAAKRLTEELKRYHSRDPVVVGIPRGGIILAWEMANALGGDMDFILAHKLRSPLNPEAAIGAVEESGKYFLHSQMLLEGMGPHDVEQERKYQTNIIKARLRVYRKWLKKMPLQGRTVIVADDGVAMGSTLEAALWSVRTERPRQLIIAIPVGPPASLQWLAQFADETVCLCAPDWFGAVSQFYLDFPPIDDCEIEEILKAEHRRRTHKEPLKYKAA